MAAYRQTRINEEIMRTLSEAIRELKDPRIQGSVVTVTDVACARDLKNATVYFSFFSTKYTEKDIKTALRGASGHLRSRLAVKMNLRETPLLAFSYDNSIERGNRVSELLRDVMPTASETEDAEKPEGSETAERADGADGN